MKIRLYILLIFFFSTYGRIVYLPVESFGGFTEEPRLELLVDLSGKWNSDYYVPFNSDEDYIKVFKEFNLDAYEEPYMYLYVPAVLGECEVYLNGWKLYVTNGGLDYIFIPIDKKYLVRRNKIEFRIKKPADAKRFLYSDLYVGILGGVYLLKGCVSYEDLDKEFKISLRAFKNINKAFVNLPYDNYYKYSLLGLSGVENHSNLYIGGRLLGDWDLISFRELQGADSIYINRVGEGSFLREGRWYKKYRFSGVKVPVKRNIHLSYWVLLLFGLVVLRKNYRYFADVRSGIGFWSLLYLSRGIGISYILYFILEYLAELGNVFWDVRFFSFADEEVAILIIMLLIAYDILRFVVWGIFRIVYLFDFSVLHYQLSSDLFFLAGSVLISIFWIQGFSSEYIIVLFLLLLLAKISYLVFILLRHNIRIYNVILYICASEILALKLIQIWYNNILW